MLAEAVSRLAIIDKDPICNALNQVLFRHADRNSAMHLIVDIRRRFEISLQTIGSQDTASNLLASEQKGFFILLYAQNSV